MAYTPGTWVENVSVIHAADLDRIEAGIAAVDAATGSASVPLTQRGTAGGVATLDGTAKIPTGQIPPLPYIDAADSLVMLSDNFAASADTAAGSAGTPDVGVGGPWIVTGGAAATVRVSGGKLISPGGDSYIFQSLPSVPGKCVQRFVFSALAGASATFGLSQPVGGTLSIAAANMIHVSVTQSFISLTVWLAGSSNIPVNNGIGANGAVTLAINVEYELSVWVVGNTVHSTVTRTSDGVLMGVYEGSDPAVASSVGSLVFIEPNATGAVTRVDVYQPKTVTPANRWSVPGGFQGPVGNGTPDAGYFSRLAVGTQVPVADLHIVQSGSAAALRVEGNTAQGALSTIRSTTGGAQTVLRLDNSSTVASGFPVDFYLPGNTPYPRLKVGGNDVYLFTTSGLAINPASGTAPQIALTGTGAGISAWISLAASGTANAAKMYQNYGSSDWRVQTGGSDSLIVTSTGALTLSKVATSTTAPAAGAAAALPATPAGYVTVTIGATARQIPYY